MNNVYELQSHPGNFQPYTGRRRADSVYIVGLGTEHEQLFTRARSRDAIKTARELKVGVIQVPATQICGPAAEALLEG